MKKPVKLTEAEVRAVIAKRKHKKITVDRYLAGGTLADVTEKLNAFAMDQKVPHADVKFVNGFGGMMLRVRRLETDEEKSKRIRNDIRWSYESKLSEYKHWEREQQREAEAAARVLNNNKAIQVVCKCNCNCKGS